MEVPTAASSVPGRTQYEDFARHVFTAGVPKHDRTGTGTVSVFGYQMRFDLSAGFLVAISLTGLVLQLVLKKRRNAALASAARPAFQSTNRGTPGFGMLPATAATLTSADGNC